MDSPGVLVTLPFPFPSANPSREVWGLEFSWGGLSGQAKMRGVSSEIWWIWADLEGIGAWFGGKPFAVDSWMLLLFQAAFLSS